MATSRSDAAPGTAASLHKDVRPLRRVLIANRGEIAVRIIRACRESDIGAVAVYSDADADALHVRLADAAVRLGPAPAPESYLRIDAIVEAALATGADAVHPGYGFLAERAAFARAVTAAGLVFIGPSAETIEALGDKLGARRLAGEAGVPTVSGTMEPAPIERADAMPAFAEVAAGIGYPLLVKAAAGGGGRGMRRVERVEDLPAALASASAEAVAAFGDGAVYLEREIRPARHIEVQVLGDLTGRIVAIGERDCSIQRRHQKLVEESPAPGLSAEDRRVVHELAVRVATAAGLHNAATVEFLRGPDGTFYFLEVNTRLQVEHGVTELTSGVDIVREQFGLAAGQPLSDAVLAAAALAAEPTTHAIEVRLTAEDPSRDFAPTPGRIGRWSMPSGPGVRVDTGFEAGDRVPPEYDNLLAKVLVVASDRPAAIDRLRRALDETAIGGVQTTLPFHRCVARHAGFRDGEVATDWVAASWDGPAERAAREDPAARAAAASFEERPIQAVPLVAPAAGGGGWRDAARADAIDRWPR